MTSNTETKPEGAVARTLRRLIDLRGLTRVATDLDVSRESLARYLGRLDLQQGTLERIERKVRERIVERANHPGVSEDELDSLVEKTQRENAAERERVPLEDVVIKCPGCGCTPRKKHAARCMHVAAPSPALRALTRRGRR